MPLPFFFFNKFMRLIAFSLFSFTIELNWPPPQFPFEGEGKVRHPFVSFSLKPYGKSPVSLDFFWTALATIHPLFLALVFRLLLANFCVFLKLA